MVGNRRRRGNGYVGVDGVKRGGVASSMEVELETVDVVGRQCGSGVSGEGEGVRCRGWLRPENDD